MEQSSEILGLAGYRTLATPVGERIPNDAATDRTGHPAVPSVGPRPTERGRLALIPATMNIAQAAAYLGIGKSTLYNWHTRRPGFGPRAVKATGALRYRRSDLDAWIEAHANALEVEAEPDTGEDGPGSNGDYSSTSGTREMQSDDSPRRPEDPSSGVAPSARKSSIQAQETIEAAATEYSERALAARVKQGLPPVVQDRTVLSKVSAMMAETLGKAAEVPQDDQVA